MKTFKKLFTILTIVLVAIMTFVPAKSLAADGDLTITVTGDVAGRTLSVYRLFNLTVTGTAENPVYNYSWADGSEAFFTAKGYDTVAKATDYLKGFANDSTQLTKLAEEFYTYCTKTANPAIPAVAKTIVDTEATSANFTVNGQGYYLIYDETTSIEAGRAISAGILQNVTANATVAIKADRTKVEKETGKETAFVGENVPFTVTTQVPNLVGYETYTFTVIDTMSKGLDFKNDVKVTIDGVEYKDETDEGVKQYTVTSSKDSETGKTTLTIAFTPAEFVKLADKKGKDIVITYSADLNSDAAVELDNTNNVVIRYSNDPDSTGTGTTPPDIVHVYTYKIDFTKKNTAGTVLPGAEFILKLSDGKYATFDANGVYTGSVAERKSATPLVSDSNGKIAVSGLKAGSYTLIETKAPEGYGIPNFEFTFTISQTLNEDGTLNTASFDYTTDVTNNAANGYMTDRTSTSASFAVDVLNAKEGALPTTGGIGTTIFTVIGIAVMAVAVVALVARNRKND